MTLKTIQAEQRKLAPQIEAARDDLDCCARDYELALACTSPTSTTGHESDGEAATAMRRLADSRATLRRLEDEALELEARGATAERFETADRRAKDAAARAMARLAAAKKHDDAVDALEAKAVEIERQRDDAGEAHAKQQRGLIASLLEKVGLATTGEDVVVAPPMQTAAFDAATTEIRRRQQALREAADSERAAAAAAAQDEAVAKADAIEAQIASETPRFVEMLARWTISHRAAKGYTPQLPDFRALAMSQAATPRDDR